MTDAPMTGDDLISMLNDGDPALSIVDDFETITINISPDLSVEHKTVLENIEFTVNTAREAISVLMQLGKASGNPRFMETIGTLLNTMNNANGQLMAVHKQRNEPTTKKKTPPTLNTIPGDEAKLIEGAVVMTAEEAMRKVSSTKV